MVLGTIRTHHVLLALTASSSDKPDTSTYSATIVRLEITFETIRDRKSRPKTDAQSVNRHNLSVPIHEPWC